MNDTFDNNGLQDPLCDNQMEDLPALNFWTHFAITPNHSNTNKFYLSWQNTSPTLQGTEFS